MKTVAIKNLRPGMILARTILNEDMIVILSEGTMLTEAHINRLQLLNIPVIHIKDEYDLSTNYQNVAAMFSPSNAFVSEYKEVVHTAREIFDMTTNEGRLPKAKTDKMVKSSIMPMVKSSGVIDYLYELNHMSNDVYNHSLRVSIMAGVIAKWLHCNKKDTFDIILAGFLHDIGKTKFSQELLEKQPEQLQDAEWEAYMQHTIDGQHILSANAAVPEGVKLAALQHHENIDGSGYPFNSTKQDIHRFARIIAIANIYDNVTTEREGYVKETPFAAIAKITQDMYNKLDPEICVPFLSNIKMAFLGSTVTLNNGFTGVIVRYPNDFAAHPLINIDNNTIIDLNEHTNLKIIAYNPK